MPTLSILSINHFCKIIYIISIGVMKSMHAAITIAIDCGSDRKSVV